MINSLSETPNANRVHITFFGRTNSGKSSVINALVGQDIAIVSDFAGTTTDPVYKPVELHPLGPAVFIDTAGFDDTTELGKMRVMKTEETLDKTNLAVLVITAGQKDFEKEYEWIETFKKRNLTFVVAVNKSDGGGEIPDFVSELDFVAVSAKTGKNIDKLRELIVRRVPADIEAVSIVGHLVKKDDHVLLVAPQDIQAPKGRLILPQVQTIRDLLDHGAVVTVTTADLYMTALSKFSSPPDLIICDSQVFNEVYDSCPEGVPVTSFSILFARFKGDIGTYLDGIERLNNLSSDAHIMILEACSHNPLDMDISRHKIPDALRKKYGGTIKIDVYSGSDMPENLEKYDLAIHCGGCMFNRAHVLNRIEKLKSAGVPVTNYGLFFANESGILDRVTI